MIGNWWMTTTMTKIDKNNSGVHIVSFYRCNTGMAGLMQQLRGPEVRPYERMKFERERIASFQRWPVSFIDPKECARAGFFFYGNRDKVRTFTMLSLYDRLTFLII